ncbi:metallophosphoesterase [Burkholderia cenocepacia]|uniref:metallophosphoesterase n=1 Tax=Burkholderia cenocepacia TaxID=95486 RepID=UPI00076D829B|nr:metallophosphoesterase [Burkholderia cenocepacia]KWU19022.1 hypothetical protein AS149_12295 [Burkholderia cenocepacia]
MLIQPSSDLHMDNASWTPPTTDADVLVFAGDLFDDGVASMRWCADLTQRTGKPVVVVPGNHDLMGARIGVRLKAMYDVARTYGVHLLHNRSVVIDDVRFVGATMWTDFEAAGQGMKTLSMHAARDMIADYSTIFTGDGHGNGRLLTPEYAVRMHQRTRRALLRGLEDAYSEKVVVVTHHGPSRRSQDEAFRSSAIAPGFVSDMDEFVGISNARCWLHGHLHSSALYMLGSTKVLCNPRGHSRYMNSNFDPELTIEV